MKELYQVSLKVIMKNDKGEYLALKPSYGNLLGSYEFAGGRINKGEFENKFEDVLSREIKEELGDIEYILKPQPVALGKHISSSDGSFIIYIFFEAVYKGGVIVLSEEHDSYDWLDLSDANLEELFKSGNLEGIRMYLAN